jgi:nicotinamidase-related amidase
MVKRIRREQCCGIIVDVQEFFLGQLDKRLRPRIETNTRNFAALLGYFRIPLVVTLERPVRHKGKLPRRVANGLPAAAATFEKDFFDLTKEEAIRNHLKGLKKKQAIVAGCETDVCVLQSCLGLLGLGYDVFVVEELLFSSAAEVDAAVARMKAEGAVFLTYKTLFYELFEAVATGDDAVVAQFGPAPDLPDAAV